MHGEGQKRSESSGLVAGLWADGEHLGMPRLLELRDGGGAVADRRHLEQCSRCSRLLAELEQTRAVLRGLDDLEPPEGLWQELSDRLAETRRVRVRRRRLAGMALAAAATLVALVGPGSWTTLRQWQADRAAHAALSDQLVDVRERSALLDREIEQLLGETLLLSGRQASAIVALEDALSRIDARLGELPHPTRGGAQPTRALSREQVERQLIGWHQRLQVQAALVELHFEPTALYEL
ncbi:MAG: hypothetical protein DWQ36_25980 [Acidobacteria bacterium]|nr:MAG: hypothetical protein DWQ30_17805 [Acidobacteriota bacterium]REJ99461.1 MAG: hypothetical protein DWQ36_25980 [Acidobacteriota bacterium]